MNKRQYFVSCSWCHTCGHTPHEKEGVHSGNGHVRRRGEQETIQQVLSMTVQWERPTTTTVKMYGHHQEKGAVVVKMYGYREDEGQSE